MSLVKLNLNGKSQEKKKVQWKEERVRQEEADVKTRTYSQRCPVFLVVNYSTSWLKPCICDEEKKVKNQLFHFLSA